MNAVSPITTHVLDTSTGRPVVGIRITVEVRSSETEGGKSWTTLGSGITNADGRIVDLLPPESLEQTRYRLRFDTAEYFKTQEIESFYPAVNIEFEIQQPDEHYHVPLLLSPFGYSTYRGS